MSVAVRVAVGVTTPVPSVGCTTTAVVGEGATVLAVSAAVGAGCVCSCVGVSVGANVSVAAGAGVKVGRIVAWTVGLEDEPRSNRAAAGMFCTAYTPSTLPTTTTHKQASTNTTASPIQSFLLISPSFPFQLRQRPTLNHDRRLSRPHYTTARPTEQHPHGVRISPVRLPFPAPWCIIPASLSLCGLRGDAKAWVTVNA